ncbi:MAG TPA: crosslink repair DNA glycosylase YcaQ family protein [Polyangiaceae bacterium]|nr:crosslink repair DNA glycosylase YcaQ family protein [Polyangiaceae bacterium]
MPTTLAELRSFAVGRSLFAPTSLARAIRRLGFVQADPIRAPARAQDLILRHRVKGYRVGDLERHYARLGIEEDFFINYGFLAPEFRALMHPRGGLEPLSTARARQAKQLLAFVARHGAVHPREVDRHLGSGTETNYWGGASNATTRLLDALHYRGSLRVARRDAGIRIYALATSTQRASAPDPAATLDALIDVAVRKYAPLPTASLSQLIGRLRYGVPQWRAELKGAALRARQRLSSAHVAGTDWFWPAQETPRAAALAFDSAPDQARLLAPFDPVVWDRRRFELLWGWAYRFEAYTPKAKRRLGYYALPLLWRAHVVGWANLTFESQHLTASFGYVSGRPPSACAFQPALDDELSRIERFLSVRAARSQGRKRASAL